MLKSALDWRENNLVKRGTVTCSKCFPAAGEVTRVWPVTCMSTFMYLEKNKQLSKMKSKTRRKEKSVGKSSW